MVGIFFFAALVFQSTVQAQINSAPVESAKQDSIHTEMVLRSEDLIWKSDWNFFSLDRMSLKINTGAYGYYGPQPEYQLDGIPFDPTIFGMNYTQLLPVSLSQIEDINIQNGLGVKNGTNYVSGLIDLRSVPLKDGLSVFGSGQFGHNSDEPGPWIFDETVVTPNVERFGPWADLGLSFKTGNWYVKGLYRSHRYLDINPHVQTRIKSLLYDPVTRDYPEAVSKTTLGLAETGFQNKSVQLKLQAIQTESEDFIYFQPLGKEIPSDFSTKQFTADGRFFLSEDFGIHAMAQYRQKDTDYRKNQLEYRFDWNQTDKIAKASFFFDTEKVRFDVGSEVHQTETIASGLTDSDQRYVELFMDQQTEVTSRLRFGTYTATTFHENQQPLRVRGFVEFDVLNGWTTTVGSSYSELLPETANPVDEWITRGYDIMDRMKIPIFIPHDIPNTKLYTLSNHHSITISDFVHVNLGAEYIHHLNLNIAYQDVYYYLFFSTTPGGYYLFPNHSGERLRLNFDTEINWLDSFTQTFGVYWSQTLEGTSTYKNYWKTVPEYLIRHSSIFTPYPDLEMRLNIQYQTETVWDELSRLDGRLNRTFHNQFPFRFFEFSNTVPANINIDLTLSKWFWEQRVRAVFMLSNLFNQKYRTHPIGSEEGFGYMLRLELRL